MSLTIIRPTWSFLSVVKIYHLGKKQEQKNKHKLTRQLVQDPAWLTLKWQQETDLDT